MIAADRHESVIPRAVWENFVATILRDMRRTSRRGFSVNFKATDGNVANDPADGLYRTGPQRWIDFCESELGCSVKTIDGNGMREFTLLIRCNGPARSEIAASRRILRSR